MTPLLTPIKKDLLVKLKGIYKRIKLEDVVGIKAEGKQVRLVLEDQNYVFKGTLKSLEDVLPKNFVRSHASSIINLDKLKEVKNRENILVLTNNVEFSYSRTFKENVLSSFHVG